jgi:hypothetical protein
MRIKKNGGILQISTEEREGKKNERKEGRKGTEQSNKYFSS